MLTHLEKHMTTKYQRLAAAHTLSLPRTLTRRSPWRAFTMATRLVAVPATAAFSSGVQAAFEQLFDPAVAFVPVFNKHPRRSHIVRPTA